MGNNQDIKSNVEACQEETKGDKNTSPKAPKRKMIEEPQGKYFNVFYELYKEGLVTASEEGITDEEKASAEKARISEMRRLHKAIRSCSDSYRLGHMTCLVVCEFLVKLIFPSQAIFARQLEWSERNSFDRFLEKMPDEFLKFFLPLTYILDMSKSSVFVTNLCAMFLQHFDKREAVKFHIRANINEILRFLADNTDITESEKERSRLKDLLCSTRQDEEQFKKVMTKYANIEKDARMLDLSDRGQVERACIESLSRWSKEEEQEEVEIEQWKGEEKEKDGNQASASV